MLQELRTVHLHHREQQTCVDLCMCCKYAFTLCSAELTALLAKAFSDPRKDPTRTAKRRYVPVIFRISLGNYPCFVFFSWLWIANCQVDLNVSAEKTSGGLADGLQKHLLLKCFVLYGWSCLS